MTSLAALASIDPPPVERGVPTEAARITLADIDTAFATVAPRLVEANEETRASLRTALPGDVLLARISPSMENGKLAVAPEAGGRALLVSRELFVIRPRPGVDVRLIWAFLRQRHVREQLEPSMRGSTQRRRLPREAIEQLDVPDLDADRLWHMLDVLDHLDQARALRMQSRDKLLELAPAFVQRLGLDRPTVPLGEIAEVVGGSTDQTSPRGPTPVLRAPNLVGGRVEFGSRRFLDRPPGAKLMLLPGDVLLPRRVGAPTALGRIGLYEGEPPEASFASGLIRVRAHPGVDPDFLWAWLQTATVRSFIRTRSGSKDRLGVRPGLLRELPVPRIGGATEGDVGGLARLLRGLGTLAGQQLGLLERALEAELQRSFGEREAASAVIEERPQRAPAEFPFPRIFEAASPRQRAAWDEATRFEEGFSIADMKLPDSGRAELQHSLLLLEQLGVLIREQDGAIHRWRLPDEVELLN